jgi:uncharacterized membrane protein
MLRVPLVMMLCLLLAWLLGLTGCTLQASESTVRNLNAIAETLNERGISHCVLVQVAVAPYGRAYIFGKTGDLDCDTLWRTLLGFGL